MPGASVISPQEKEEILIKAAELRAKNNKITQAAIGKVVGRSPNAISKLSKDDRFELYKLHFKQKIDKQRFKAIESADERVFKAISKGKMKPYQLIGASKTYYEQSFGIQEKQGQINNDVKVGVQIVRKMPDNVPYSDETIEVEPE